MGYLSDEQIVGLYFDRNELAISETDSKYGPYCTRVAFNVLRDSFASEECVSDTWLAAWNSMPPQRPNILRAFLAKITRNLALNRYEAEHAQKRGGGETESCLDELAELVSGGGDPLDDVTAAELSAAISRFLKTLPEREANILIRRYFFTEPVKEIAERCGMTANAVSVTLSRGRNKLKGYLEKEGYQL